jgi:hypothetical protein
MKKPSFFERLSNHRNSPGSRFNIGARPELFAVPNLDPEGSFAMLSSEPGQAQTLSGKCSSEEGLCLHRNQRTLVDQATTTKNVMGCVNSHR